MEKIKVLSKSDLAKFYAECDRSEGVGGEDQQASAENSENCTPET